MSYTLEILHRDRNDELTVVASRKVEAGEPWAATFASALDERMPTEFLEEVWREFNVVDGTELPALLGIRSMMVGDQVRIKFHYDFWNAVRRGYVTWAVMNVGWMRVEAQDYTYEKKRERVGA